MESLDESKKLEHSGDLLGNIFVTEDDKSKTIYWILCRIVVLYCVFSFRGSP